MHVEQTELAVKEEVNDLVNKIQNVNFEKEELVIIFKKVPILTFW